MMVLVGSQPSALSDERSALTTGRSALVIVPTYNENDHVAALIAAVLGACPEVHLLFVDDNSPDGTGQTLDAIAEDHNQVHVLHRDRKLGLGRAYIAGFRWALARPYDFVLGMDADFSHNPADIPRLLEAATAADVALGSRYVGGTRVTNWSRARLLLSRGAGLYVRFLTGLGFADPTGGFRCYRRAGLEAIDLDRIVSNGYAFQIELTHQAWMRGFQGVEIPITFKERVAGRSKMSWAIIVEAIWRVPALLIRSRFRRKPGVPHPRSVRLQVPSP